MKLAWNANILSIGKYLKYMFQGIFLQNTGVYFLYSQLNNAPLGGGRTHRDFFCFGFLFTLPFISTYRITELRGSRVRRESALEQIQDN